MSARSGTVVAGWAGIVGIVLTAVGGPLANEFAVAADPESPSSIVDFYRQTSFGGAYVAGVIVETIGFLLILVLLVRIAGGIGSSGTGARWIGYLVIAAATAATATTIIGVAPRVAGTYRAAHGGLSGDGYVVLEDLRFFLYWLSLPVWGLILAPIGVVNIRMRLFPQWLGWTAIVIAVALFVAVFLPSATWDPITGFEGLWLLVAAISMLAGPDRFAATEAA